MQGLVRCVVVAGTLLGCGPGGVGPQDDTPDSDAMIGPSGLVIEWSSSPSDWPSTSSNVMLERARFAINNLRVVGDAGPGDPRTTIANLEMGYAWRDGDQRPLPITFDNAPTGLYSQVAIRFDPSGNPDGKDTSYEIRGHVDVNSQNWEFRIEDKDPMPFNVAVNEMVRPGEMATIKLRINFLHALDSLNWASLNISDNRIELDENDSQMPAFRAKLIESFEIY